ncbi:family 16 glycosylhydrolase [Oceanipulchritudo coccoides]|nr:family 16 glycosylhydrolase [Oceanipulchritudo coccoides]
MKKSSSPYRVLLRLLSLLALVQAPLAAPAEYLLVWSDEFNLPDGSAPDPANWNYDIGGWGWGNQESQYYTTSTDNARIENGELVIELRDDTGLNGAPDLYPNNDYTSARLLTKDKHDWRYGRIEARIKVPDGGAGLWPAFWMLGNDIDAVGWPQCGEIDIMEYVSRLPDEIFGTIHGPGYSGGAAYGNIYYFGQPVANDYHTYAVEWEPNQIRWYVDDILYHIASPADIAPNQWVFDHNHFIILNVAIGGTFGGGIARNITFPQRMLVDYVRVYQNDEIALPTVDIPGVVQAEDYSNQSGARFETTTDSGGGLNAGFLADGDYLEYLLNSPVAGTYSLEARVASGTDVTGRLIFSTESDSVSSPDITNTGGWQAWSTLAVGEIDLPAGLVTLRMTVESPGPGIDAMNINWMDVQLVNISTDYGMFNGFDWVNGWVDTGAFMGWVNLENYPWTYVEDLDSYIYAAPSTSPGGWIYLPK